LKDFLRGMVDHLVGSRIVPVAKDLLALFDVDLDVGLLLFALWRVAHKLFMAALIGPLDVFLHQPDHLSR
jgi:hypothetical protein